MIHRTEPECVDVDMEREDDDDACDFAREEYAEGKREGGGLVVHVYIDYMVEMEMGNRIKSPADNAGKEKISQFSCKNMGFGSLKLLTYIKENYTVTVKF